MAHGKTTRVSEAAVRAEVRPEFTATWHPWSHGDVLDAVGDAVSRAGFKVERAEYSMSAGDQMFAVWEIDKGDPESRFAIGIRNSIAKSLAVGICAGRRVFVCDNLAFSSSFVLFRKHTNGLDIDELFLMARTAMATVVPQWDHLKAWHERMKRVNLTIREESAITIAALRRNIIQAREFADFERLYHGNGAPAKYTATLHGWHGAVTELWNDKALMANAARQKALNDFIDAEVPVILADGLNDLGPSWREIEDKAAIRAEVMDRNAREDARAVRDEMVRTIQSMRRLKNPPRAYRRHVPAIES